ncbi:hypothetical protein HPB50_024052 [Hyalomma asiaticum]|uniref:Uncharacterized protein n=1 Tax=Hyalomma asiaticum TaxID=266040 RepID=A0ACB7ST07_HYAAI|nr:hypothetical protein HPB50_024052 [Hyalomma asiaticum]
MTVPAPYRVGLHRRAQDCLRLASSSVVTPTSMYSVRCFMMVLAVAGHSSVLPSVNSQPVMECHELCGGFADSMCVDECHCVFYEDGDYGVCLPHWMNETDLLPM